MVQEGWYSLWKRLGWSAKGGIGRGGSGDGLKRAVLVREDVGMVKEGWN